MGHYVSSMTANNKIAAVGAAVAVGTAVAGAAVESLPVVAVAAAVGLVAVSIKLIAHHREQSAARTHRQEDYAHAAPAH
jgi:hypothetical protein